VIATANNVVLFQFCFSC